MPPKSNPRIAAADVTSSVIPELEDQVPCSFTCDFSIKTTNTCPADLDDALVNLHFLNQTYSIQTPLKDWQSIPSTDANLPDPVKNDTVDVVRTFSLSLGTYSFLSPSVLKTFIQNPFIISTISSETNDAPPVTSNGKSSNKNNNAKSNKAKDAADGVLIQNFDANCLLYGSSTSTKLVSKLCFSAAKFLLGSNLQLSSNFSSHVSTSVEYSSSILDFTCTISCSTPPLNESLRKLYNPCCFSVFNASSLKPISSFDHEQYAFLSVKILSGNPLSQEDIVSLYQQNSESCMIENASNFTAGNSVSPSSPNKKGPATSNVQPASSVRFDEEFQPKKPVSLLSFRFPSKFILKENFSLNYDLDVCCLLGESVFPSNLLHETIKKNSFVSVYIHDTEETLAINNESNPFIPKNSLNEFKHKISELYLFFLRKKSIFDAIETYTNASNGTGALANKDNAKNSSKSPKKTLKDSSPAEQNDTIKLFESDTGLLVESCNIKSNTEMLSLSEHNSLETLKQGLNEITCMLFCCMHLMGSFNLLSLVFDVELKSYVKSCSNLTTLKINSLFIEFASNLYEDLFQESHANSSLLVTYLKEFLSAFQKQVSSSNSQLSNNQLSSNQQLLNSQSNNYLFAPSHCFYSFGTALINNVSDILINPKQTKILFDAFFYPVRSNLKHQKKDQSLFKQLIKRLSSFHASTSNSDALTSLVNSEPLVNKLSTVPSLFLHYLDITGSFLLDASWLISWVFQAHQNLIEKVAEYTENQASVEGCLHLYRSIESTSSNFDVHDNALSKLSKSDSSSNIQSSVNLDGAKHVSPITSNSENTMFFVDRINNQYASNYSEKQNYIRSTLKNNNNNSASQNNTSNIDDNDVDSIHLDENFSCILFTIPKSYQDVSCAILKWIRDHNHAVACDMFMTKKTDSANVTNSQKKYFLTLDKTNLTPMQMFNELQTIDACELLEHENDLISSLDTEYKKELFKQKVQNVLNEHAKKQPVEDVNNNVSANGNKPNNSLNNNNNKKNVSKGKIDVKKEEIEVPKIEEEKEVFSKEILIKSINAKLKNFDFLTGFYVNDGSQSLIVVEGYRNYGLLALKQFYYNLPSNSLLNQHQLSMTSSTPNAVSNAFNSINYGNTTNNTFHNSTLKQAAIKTLNSSYNSSKTEINGAQNNSLLFTNTSSINLKIVPKCLSSNNVSYSSRNYKSISFDCLKLNATLKSLSVKSTYTIDKYSREWCANNFEKFDASKNIAPVTPEVITADKSPKKAVKPSNNNSKNNNNNNNSNTIEKAPFDLSSVPFETRQHILGRLGFVSPSVVLSLHKDKTLEYLHENAYLPDSNYFNEKGNNLIVYNNTKTTELNSVPNSNNNKKPGKDNNKDNVIEEIALSSVSFADQLHNPSQFDSLLNISSIPSLAIGFPLSNIHQLSFNQNNIKDFITLVRDTDEDNVNNNNNNSTDPTSLNTSKNVSPNKNSKNTKDKSITIAPLETTNVKIDNNVKTSKKDKLSKKVVIDIINSLLSLSNFSSLNAALNHIPAASDLNLLRDVFGTPTSKNDHLGFMQFNKTIDYSNNNTINSNNNKLVYSKAASSYTNSIFADTTNTNSFRQYNKS